MPHSVYEQERALLSVAIQWPAEGPLGDLREEEFEDNRHRAVFRAIRRCNGACDLPIVTDWLLASKDIPGTLSISDINDLAMMEATPLSAPAYRKAIREAAALRAQATLNRAMAERIERGLATAEELAAQRRAEQARVDLRSLDAEASDIAASSRLIERHGDKIRYCHQLGGWYVWNGIVLEPDATQRILALAAETARAFTVAEAASGDRRRINKALSFESSNRLVGSIKVASADSRVTIRPGDLDQRPDLLATANSVIDLRTGSTIASSPALLMTEQAVVAFDPDAKCPRWERFMSEIMCGRPELVEFLRRWIGYCLTGHTREQVMVVAYGLGANGKGTLWETICRYVLGKPLADESPPKLLLSKSQDNHPTELMTLFGRRLISASEVPTSSRWDESRVKLLTGEDTITARGMRQDFVSFQPTHKIVAYLNNKPDVRDTSHAFWRRIRLVPFEAKFEGAAKDGNLRTTLAAEAPGILNWALDGARSWYESGLTMPDSVAQATADYRQSQDHVARWLSERTDDGKESQVMAATLHQEYKTWWAGQGFDDKAAMSMKAIANQLKTLGYSATRTKAGMRWDLTPAGCRVYDSVGKTPIIAYGAPAIGVIPDLGYTKVHPTPENLSLAEDLGPGADDDW